MARVLPTHAFHVVFTLPEQLRALCGANQVLLYNQLLGVAAETLLELGNTPKWLGAGLGVTSVLHTWTRELTYHPHVHCVVTGGGLSLDGQSWVATRPSFLFPVRVLGDLFRGKFLAGLRQAKLNHQLEFSGPAKDLAEPGRFEQLCKKLSETRWNVYAKPPFGGPKEVFQYLAKYTHRTGISNRRLVSMENDKVTFRTRGENTVTIPGKEFLRRFLQHVLPKGFVKIRHHGLLAPGNVNSALAKARELLEPAKSPPGPTETPPAAAPVDFRDLLQALTGVDLRKCPSCGGVMARLGLEDAVEPGLLRDTS
jgi:hypothetical protein